MVTGNGKQNKKKRKGKVLFSFSFFGETNLKQLSGIGNFSFNLKKKYVLQYTTILN